jgi:hypothetical protein
MCKLNNSLQNKFYGKLKAFSLLLTYSYNCNHWLFIWICLSIWKKYFLIVFLTKNIRLYSARFLLNCVWTTSVKLQLLREIRNFFKSFFDNHVMSTAYNYSSYYFAHRWVSFWEKCASFLLLYLGFCRKLF